MLVNIHGIRMHMVMSNAKQNGQNISKNIVSKTTSKYLGMCYDVRCKKWITTIKKGGKCIFVYRNKNELITAKKRDLYILNNPDLHYKLNFK